MLYLPDRATAWVALPSRNDVQEAAFWCRQRSKSGSSAIAHIAKAITRPTITALSRTLTWSLNRNAQGDTTSHTPNAMLTASSHALGNETPTAAKITTAAPSNHAFHAASLVGSAYCITQGDTNNHAPSSKLTQSCQRLDFIASTSS